MGYSLKEIAEIVNGKCVGDSRSLITGANALDRATGGDISFFVDRRFKEALMATRAAAVLVSETKDIFSGPQIVVGNPLLAFARVAGLFAAPASSRAPGISEHATVHESSKIGEDVSIYPHVYIGEEAIVGNGVVLFPGVYIGDRVQIGDRTLIYPNVNILNDCLIGADVIIHAGTTIGSDGFGFVRDGAENVKIPQTGIVRIDDHVEIGANNTIDRATVGQTWIQKGVKTDNLVQIAHNVVIGKDTILVAQAAVGGSVTIGNGVVIGSQVAIRDHLKIGDRAMIGSQSGVAKAITQGEIVSGTPTMPHKLWLKTRGLIMRLPGLNDRVRAMEKKIRVLEEHLKI